MAMYFTVYMCVHKPPEVFPKDEPIVHTARNISGSAFCTQHIFLSRHRWEFPPYIWDFWFSWIYQRPICRMLFPWKWLHRVQVALPVAVKSESHMTSECDHTCRTSWTLAMYMTLQLSFSEDIIRIRCVMCKLTIPVHRFSGANSLPVFQNNKIFSYNKLSRSVAHTLNFKRSHMQ